jgi:uncharacterized alkaline shock family protein YloU
VTHQVRTPRGAITLTDAALTSIVIRAAEQVDGARVRRPKRGLDLELAGGSVKVSLELAARFGAVLPELGRDVQQRVATALQEMTGLRVSVVDVAIEELDG